MADEPVTQLLSTYLEAVTNVEFNPNDRENLEAVAYHEAGHAVAALALGHRFKDMYIGPRRKSVKYREEDLERIWNEDDAALMAEHIIVTMAGAASSENKTGSPPNWDDDAYHCDRTSIVDLLSNGEAMSPSWRSSTARHLA